jgi:hypothetical protein
VTRLAPGAAQRFDVAQFERSLLDALPEDIRRSKSVLPPAERLALAEAMQSAGRNEDADGIAGSLLNELGSGAYGPIACQARLVQAKAINDLRQRDRAIARFTDIARHCTADDVRAWALYFAGKCAFGDKRYPESDRLFAELERELPRHRLADDARWYRAQAQLELGDDGRFTETTSYDPSSAYSASKAASDHLVRAYHRTYGLPIKITNCSNNYGPYQFPEKLVPLMILNAVEGRPLPVYGRGENVRDWLFVDDHCEAIWNVIEKGRVGETYNIGGRSEQRTIDVVRAVCEVVASETGRPLAPLLDLITFVADRPGHDARYAIDPTKVERECGFVPRETFESGLRKTVRFYLEHQDWVRSVRTGEYRAWLEKNYAGRS